MRTLRVPVPRQSLHLPSPELKLKCCEENPRTRASRVFVNNLRTSFQTSHNVAIQDRDDRPNGLWSSETTRWI